MLQTLTGIQEDMNGRIPEQIGQVNDRLNSVTEETRINEENVRMIETLLRQSQDKIGDLLGLKNDFTVAKDGISKIEQTVNSVKSDVLVLSDSNNDHEGIVVDNLYICINSYIYIYTYIYIYIYIYKYRTY
jgi:hypothetical protein